MAGVFVVGLLLAGCGGDPGPQPVVLTEAPTEWPTELGPSPTPHDTPSEDPAPDPTPDPEESPQPPVWDPALNEPTVDNALAFGQYFMELYSYVVATGDTSEWRELSHPECGFCTSTVEYAEEHPGGQVRAQVVPTSGEQINDTYYALNYQLTEWLGQEAEPTTYAVYIGVFTTGDRWQMRAVQIDEADDDA